MKNQFHKPLKIAQGIQEKGIIIGNAYDKYGSSNPVERWLINGFTSAMSDLVDRVNPASIYEVGCGEGYWTLQWLEKGIAARGSDFSEKVISLARENAKSRGVSPDIFSARSIYDIAPDCDSADLLVCCEVLEHLENPEAGLAALQRVAIDHVILSVPHEPLWRLLNLVRGKYWRNTGNTPGHIQHWSRKEFIKLVSRYFEIAEIRTPLPWTMLLCRKR
jgi:ubiquinone/menaquinone biosynthesis C-methylase UbiE